MNRFLLTPYSLDRPERALHRLAKQDWTLNEPELPAGVALQRLAAVGEPIGEA